ncbi:MAG: TetR family transcriptional regulator [Methylovirgula sp.]
MALRSLPSKPSTDLRLLELATEHVRRHGAAHLTITEIADAASMSHANVYRYFRSKTALLEAVTTAWLAPLEAGLRVIADAPDPVYDKLERLLFAIHRGYNDKLAADPKIFDLFYRATEMHSDIARRHQQRIAQALHRILEEGSASGAYVIEDQAAAIHFVLDAMYRFLSPVAVRDDVDISRSVLEKRASRLLRAIGRILASGGL